MALSENGSDMVMPVGPMYGNDGGVGNWNDGSFWIVILFLFAFMGNGWGNGYNGGPVQTQNDVQRGFDQQAVMTGISGINNALATAEVSRCNAQSNILETLNNMAANFQNCCCDNRVQLADLKYTISTEACADRQAVTDALRDVNAHMTASTQMILDKMCQQEIEALKTQNENLRTQINLANLQASQNAQTAQIIADNGVQTQYLVNTLRPTPIPAYTVANPFTGTTTTTPTND